MRLERATPEAMGLSSQAILDFLKAAQKHEMHSFMLLKGGKVVCERWWEPFSPNYRHQMFSVSKSFTSTAIGMAVDEGLLTVDTLLADIFTTEFEQIGQKMDDEIRGMTIKNLLTMSTGMEYEAWDSARELWETAQGATANHIVSFLSGHVKENPGQVFRYSTIATFMLSAAITRLTGQTVRDYLQPRLFEPLGITDLYWRTDEGSGASVGGFGLNITTESLAKFGQFLLQKGMWKGKQLVSQAWIEEATAKHIDNSNERTGDWALGYGYQFWRCSPEGAYRGDGMFGQYCIVLPNENIVIAATSNGDMQQVLDLFWDLIDNFKKMPADANAEKELDAYTNFTHLTLEEATEAYPTFMAEYKMEQGSFSSISFDFDGKECIMAVYQGGNKNPNAAFRFVNGQWTKGAAPHLTPFPPYYPERINRVAAKGDWNKQTFTTTTWFYESACKDQYRFTFNKDEITFEMRGGNFNTEFELVSKGVKDKS